MGNPFVFPRIRIQGTPLATAKRAEIKVRGVDQSGPSFEVLVFLNNPNATIATPPTPEQGYAGAFHVYGFGTQSQGRQHSPTLTDYSVVATEAVRRATQQGTEVTVALVPRYYTNPPAAAANILSLQGITVEAS